MPEIVAPATATDQGLQGPPTAVITFTRNSNKPIEAGNTGETGKEGPEGKAGKNGKEGSPWTDGGTLPAGATETGVWAWELPGGATSTKLKTAVSFPIPLATVECGEEKIPQGVCSETGNEDVHIFEGTTIPAGCSGTIFEGRVLELKAEAGDLCVWVRGGIKAGELRASDVEVGEAGAGTHGFILNTLAGVAEHVFAEGTWAVTG
jgi:hypothetical protein